MLGIWTDMCMGMGTDVSTGECVAMRLDMRTDMRMDNILERGYGQVLQTGFPRCINHPPACLRLDHAVVKADMNVGTPHSSAF